MKTIKINSHGIGRYTDVSPFPLGSLDIALTGLPACSGDFRFLAFMNGVNIRKQSIMSDKDNVISFAENELCAGKFSCFVSHYTDGIEVKRYLVEDLVITELNGELTSVPEIAALKSAADGLSRRLDACEPKLEELVKSVEQLDARLGETKEQVKDGHETLGALFAGYFNDLKKETSALKEEFEGKIRAERKRTVSLLKFAYSDYRQNVYLDDGGDIGSFLSRYGFDDLTPEEIQFIKEGEQT